MQLGPFAVALAHGFWHLGQFAQDYRRMYAETPTQTLARAQGRVTPLGTGYRAGRLAAPDGDQLTAAAGSL